MSDLNEWLTVAQAAQRKSVSRQAISGAIHRGELETVAVGRERLLKIQQVEEWKPRNYGARQEIKPQPPPRPRGRPKKT